MISIRNFSHEFAHPFFAFKTPVSKPALATTANHKVEHIDIRSLLAPRPIFIPARTSKRGIVAEPHSISNERA